LSLEFIEPSRHGLFLDISAAEISRTLLFGPAGFESYARILELPDPAFDGQQESDSLADDAEAAPSEVGLVALAIELLGAAAGSAQDLRFLLWTGWPYQPRLAGTRTVLFTPIRECVMARGTLRDLEMWATARDTERDFPPSLVWPADHSWCVAFDVDAHFAGVGASTNVIEHLIKSERRAVPANRAEIPPMYR